MHSSVDRHLDCFHVFDIVNSAALNTGMHVSFQIGVFLKTLFQVGSLILPYIRLDTQKSSLKYTLSCLHS